MDCNSASGDSPPNVPRPYVTKVEVVPWINIEGADINCPSSIVTIKDINILNHECLWGDTDLMNKKGISPLIATILLVALVIAIALIVWFWYTNFLQDQTRKIGEKAIAEGECTLAIDFKVESVSCFDKNNDGTNDNIILNLRNEGKTKIDDFRVRIYGSTNSKMVIIGESLPETYAKQTSVEFDPATIGTVQRVEVMPIIATEGIVKTCTNKVAIVPITDC